MSRLYDAIVIGTGVSGLTAGLALQRAGHSVLLLEAGKAFGGLLNPFPRKGHWFDVGLHYVGEAGPGQYLRRLLDSLGLETVQFRELNPDCVDRYVFDGYEARTIKGVDRWCGVLARDFPHEARNIWRFARLLKNTDRLIRMCLDKPALGDLWSLMRSPVEFANLFRVSYGTVLNGYFKDPLLKGVFGAATGILGLPPSEASAYMAMAGLMHFLKGSYFPRGGSRAVRDAYVHALGAAGAELLRNQPVTRIEKLADGTFVVTTSTGGEFRGRATVSAIDGKRTLEMLVGAAPDHRTSKVAQKVRPSRSAFALFMVTDLDLAKVGLNDANLWYYGSPNIDAAYAANAAGRVPERPFFFLASPTLKDPSTRTDGTHCLEVATWLPADRYKSWFDAQTKRRGAEYEQRKAEDEERMFNWVERFVPGLRAHIMMRESATPATVWSYTRAPQGGIFGPNNTPDWSPFRRFSPVTGIPGLVLVGASVHGPGIFTCVLGGILGARLCGAYLRDGGVRSRRRALLWLLTRRSLLSSPSVSTLAVADSPAVIGSRSGP